jgi:hypothetical protein
LDLATILNGKTAADTFKNSLDLAQHTERWGLKDIGLPNITAWKALPAQPPLC